MSTSLPGGPLRPTRSRLLKQAGAIVTVFGLSLGVSGYIVAAHRAAKSPEREVVLRPAPAACPSEQLEAMPAAILDRTPYSSRDALLSFLQKNKADWNKALDSLHAEFDKRVQMVKTCMQGNVGSNRGQAMLTFDLSFAGTSVKAWNFDVYKVDPVTEDTPRVRACFAQHFNAAPLEGQVSAPFAAHYRGAAAYPLNARF